MAKVKETESGTLIEKNNFVVGRSGCKVPRLPGVRPKANINPTKGGGIFRALKSN